jgi:hypothetical protein
LHRVSLLDDFRLACGERYHVICNVLGRIRHVEVELGDAQAELSVGRLAFFRDTR